MPNNKKRPNNKKKKGGREAERTANLARRAERLRPPDSSIQRLPSFPGPETHEQELERILGYKNLSFEDGEAVSFTRRENGKFRIQEISNDMKPGKYSEFVPPPGGSIGAKFFPDYDRNKAEYPAFRGIVTDLPPVDDVARRARKRIGDVPSDSRDVFLRFVERGEGIRVRASMEAGWELDGKAFGCEVSLSGAEYAGENCQALCLLLRKNCITITFYGSLDTATMEKYHKELVTLLKHECMHRVASGTAELDGEVDSEGLIDALAIALQNLYTEKKCWTDLVHLFAFLLDRAIENKFSLSKTAGIENNLGEALESCGLHSQAALIYAEAGRQLLLAEHPMTPTMIQNAAVALKRHGDREAAEEHFALALKSMALVHDHAKYRQSVFLILRNLFVLYFDSRDFSVKLVLTLRALILGAGEVLDSPGVYHENGAPALRSEYRNAAPADMCRVIQSIVIKSTSGKEMREAILACANPDVVQIEIGHKSGKRRTKDFARKWLLDACKETAGFMSFCSACGESKDEKSLAICPCKRARYCNAVCQKNHWPHHKAECTAGRKVTKKRNNEDKNMCQGMNSLDIKNNSNA